MQNPVSQEILKVGIEKGIERGIEEGIEQGRRQEAALTLRIILRSRFPSLGTASQHGKDSLGGRSRVHSRSCMPGTERDRSRIDSAEAVAASLLEQILENRVPVTLADECPSGRAQPLSQAAVTQQFDTRCAEGCR